MGTQAYQVTILFFSGGNTLGLNEILATHGDLELLKGITHLKLSEMHKVSVEEADAVVPEEGIQIGGVNFHVVHSSSNSGAMFGQIVTIDCSNHSSIEP